MLQRGQNGSDELVFFGAVAPRSRFQRGAGLGLWALAVLDHFELAELSIP